LPALGPLPPTLVAFAATVLLGFLIGIELHSYRRETGPDLGFGTTRTFTVLAILGFTLWLLDPSGMLYASGLVATALLLAIYYWHRAQAGKLSLLPTLVALLVYGLGPVAQTQPLWFLVLYVVTVIVMLGEQPLIRRLSDAFPGDEAVTLAKFLIMLGVILPLLPVQRLGPLFGDLTYHQVWLAVVAVSAISYLSYLAQRFFFPGRGPLLTAALGGLYSSTAVTVVLSRRARQDPAQATHIAPALVLATAMMYLRLWVIILALGSPAIAVEVAKPFLPAFLTSVTAAYLLARRPRPGSPPRGEQAVRNPLELPLAFLFALLLVGFVALVEYALQHFGSWGLKILGLLAGFGDVDAFIIALLSGKFAVSAATLVNGIVLASASNNLLKAVCAALLARRRELLPAVLWLLALFAASLLFVYGVRSGG